MNKFNVFFNFWLFILVILVATWLTGISNDTRSFLITLVVGVVFYVAMAFLISIISKKRAASKERKSLEEAENRLRPKKRK